MIIDIPNVFPLINISVVRGMWTAVNYVINASLINVDEAMGEGW